ncbi:MAG: HlyD family efflux transporter periplasmic adaptor subunit, partial [Planctomycetota bacterium]
MITNRITGQLGTFKPVKKRGATIHLVQSSRFASRLAKLLLIGLAASILAMAFLPWQQTSRGAGEVVAFVPQERQQTVKATAKGIVKQIADGLVEGVEVKKGDFLLEIQPFAGDMVQQIDIQLAALNTKQATAEAQVDAFQKTIDGYTEARDYAVEAAGELVAAAEAKLESKQQEVLGFIAGELQARLNYERQKGLWERGFKAEKEVEKLRKELDVAVAKLESGNREVTALEKTLEAKRKELEEKRSVAQTKIDYNRAMQAKAEGDIATVQKEKGDLVIKQRELDRLIIHAPRDGTVFRLNVNERGDTVKEGDPLLTIVPQANQKAVELYVVG